MTKNISKDVSKRETLFDDATILKINVISIKIKNLTSYYPFILFLGIYTKDSDSFSISMFIDFY